ncbi:hypothetical protein LTSEURB_1598, partial [Salmonella enterica subsp. enterica serovar Urbana str. R8-2977]
MIFHICAVSHCRNNIIGQATGERLRILHRFIFKSKRCASFGC